MDPDHAQTAPLDNPPPAPPRALGRAGPVAVVALALPIIGSVTLVALSPIVAPWLRAQGTQGWVVFTVAFALLGAVALAPTHSTSIVAGWAFGFALGFPAVMLGTVGGATICYAVARRLAGERVQATFAAHPKWEVVRRALLEEKPLKTLWIVFLMRLSPVLPFGTTNVLLATTGVPLPIYAAGTAAGLMPRLALLTLAAARAERLDFDAAESWWLLAFGLLATVACIAVLAVMGRHALDRATRRHGGIAGAPASVNAPLDASTESAPSCERPEAPEASGVPEAPAAAAETRAASEAPEPPDAARTKARPVRRFLRHIGPAGPFALLVTAMPALGAVVVFSFAGRIVPWLHHHGWLGLVVFMIGFVVLGGFAIVPTYASSIIGGWTFRFALGFPAVMLGLGGAALISYRLAHRVVGRRVENEIHAHPKWEAVRDALVGGSTMRTIGIIVLLRLSPLLPFETTNVVLAMCGVRPLPYLLGTWIGVAPRTVAIVFAASRAEQFDPRAAGSGWMLLLGLVMTLVCLSVIGLIAKHALDRATRDRRPARDATA